MKMLRFESTQSEIPLLNWETLNEAFANQHGWCVNRFGDPVYKHKIFLINDFCGVKISADITPKGFLLKVDKFFPNKDSVEFEIFIILQEIMSVLRLASQHFDERDFDIYYCVDFSRFANVLLNITVELNCQDSYKKFIRLSDATKYKVFLDNFWAFIENWDAILRFAEIYNESVLQLLL